MTADGQRLVLRTVAEESVAGMDFPTVAGLVKAAGRPLGELTETVRSKIGKGQPQELFALSLWPDLF
jgi:hypothetical protein